MRFVPDRTIFTQEQAVAQNVWPPEPVPPVINNTIIMPPADVGVPFDFTSGSQVLQQVLAGNVIDSAWIRIDVPFNDPAATIALGTSTSPTLIFGPGDVSPTVVNQYTNQAFEYFAFTDLLSLVISPGTSTQGKGLLLYRYSAVQIH